VRGIKIAFGDLNGDGLNDVAVMGERSGEQHILIYHQNSQGTFNPAVDIPVQDLTLRGLATGDVNHDGREDLVVSGVSKTASAGWLGRMVVFYQNPTNGTLEPSQEVVLSSMDVGDLCVADLNSEGRKDIAVLGSPASAAKGNIAIFYQKNDGALDQEFIYKEAFVRVSGAIKAADMNDDGRNDLVFQSGDGEFAVVRQSENGSLSALPDLYTIPADTYGFMSTFTVGDANGDGRNDVVLVSSGAVGFFHLFLQNGAGRLDPPVQINLQQNPPDAIELADISGDGLNDIVAAFVNADASSGSNIRVYYQGADHSFSASGSDSFVVRAASVGETASHVSLGVSDVTGDSLRDVVVTGKNEGLSVLPGVRQDSTQMTFSISGVVKTGGAPLSGVTVTLGGIVRKTTTTDASGNYAFAALGNGDYTVTPSKTGYSFSPASRAVTISGAEVTGQDFTATTYSISGKVMAGGIPLSGVTITLGGTLHRTTTTDPNGNYTLVALGDGDYTVTPSKTGYSFSPANRSVTISGAEVTGQDFTGTTYSISGKVMAGGTPLSGVNITLSGVTNKVTTTNANGDYTLTIVGNGNYVVAPSKAGYTFSPVNRPVTVNGADVAGQDFTGTTYSISGKVMAGGVPLSGVTIALSGTMSKTTTTNASGDYTLTVVGNGNYTVTPSKAGYTFLPVNRPVTVNGADVTGQDFTGS
jgi:inhibitor of cysteine peptidase